MEHSFDTELAKEIGMLEAILLKHIYYWCNKNKLNSKNFFDGNYWTYNSSKSFAETFEYASEKQLNTALKHLINDGYILVGNYNKVKFDRTKWYALTEKGISSLLRRNIDLTKWINGDNENVKSDLTKRVNGNDENVNSDLTNR